MTSKDDQGLRELRRLQDWTNVLKRRSSEDQNHVAPWVTNGHGDAVHAQHPWLPNCMEPCERVRRQLWFEDLVYEGTTGSRTRAIRPLDGWLGLRSLVDAFMKITKRRRHGANSELINYPDGICPPPTLPLFIHAVGGRSLASATGLRKKIQQYW